jgi:hypothetical protein
MHGTERPRVRANRFWKQKKRTGPSGPGLMDPTLISIANV